MAKPRAKTLQERMGFVDADLRTPAHDAIMLWLDSEVKSRLADWLSFPTTWDAWLAQQRPRDGEPTISLASLGDLPPQPGFSVDKTVWEAPVRNAKGYELGFIDLLAWYTRQGLYHRHFVGSGRWEWGLEVDAHAVGFEVKSTISSLGELFRQLALYREHFPGCGDQRWGCRHCRLFVVSPDARFAAKIREQGYGFILYPGEGAAREAKAEEVCALCGTTEGVKPMNGRGFCRACLTGNGTE